MTSTKGSGKSIALRKIVHLTTGLTILLLSFWVNRPLLLMIMTLGGVFAFATFNSKAFRPLHHTNRQSLGTLFYPIGVVAAFLLLYNKPILYFQTSLMILTVSDTVASWAGKIKPGNIRFNTYRDEKSLFGAVGFALSAMAIFYFMLPSSLYPSHSFILLGTLLAVNFEVISHRGSDNLSIPIGTALFFLIMENHNGSLEYLTLLVAFSALGAYLLFHLQWLTKNASILAYFLSVFFLGALGYQWMLTAVFFFSTSVLLTKANAFYEGKKRRSNQRNAWQAMANIFWGILTSTGYLLTGDQIFIHLFICALASVTADTWASEAGPIFHSKSFSLNQGRMKPSGISGGISPMGTLAALAGSVFTTTLALWLFYGSTPWHLLIKISLCAFFGMMVDSVLGAFLEPRLEKSAYFTARYHKKEHFTPNDLINLSGTLGALLLYLLLFA